MTEKTRIAVIGATSVIAEHCCRLWVQRGPVDLLLVARDAARTERIAADDAARPRGHADRATAVFVPLVGVGRRSDRYSRRQKLERG